jgi:hypothetical protein
MRDKQGKKKQKKNNKQITNQCKGSRFMLLQLMLSAAQISLEKMTVKITSYCEEYSYHIKLCLQKNAVD